MTKQRPGRKPYKTTQAILDMIQEHWADIGPQGVLEMARSVRPTLTMANLRNYYHLMKRANKVKNHIGYTRLTSWSEDDLSELRRMAEFGMSAGAIAKELNVRRWAVLAACSAHGISVKRVVNHD